MRRRISPAKFEEPSRSDNNIHMRYQVMNGPSLQSEGNHIGSGLYRDEASTSRFLIAVIDRGSMRNFMHQFARP